MRPLGSLLAAGLLLALPAAGPAAPPVASAGPEAVAVTVYRDPIRSAGQPMQLNWLNGYALITETRRVRVPAGEADIRFEGVAGGILPETAIVTGLPGGAVEKNQDAYLLSPASLLDRSLGRRVHLRRTSARTGVVREQEAIVRSGAQGAVVLQTAEGFEALRCTGLKETIVYDEVPEGLSAKPTLSVRTRSPGEATATVTLSYLASGFDWQANYVATIDPAGDRLDLFAWVTLASMDETSFPHADTQTVAGRANHDASYRPRPWGRPLYLSCWPSGTTSDVPGGEVIVVTGSRLALANRAAPPPPPPPPPPAPAAMEARQEELGDLKLYRIPEPVTVAAKSQKQVAMFERRGVRVRQLHISRIVELGSQDSVPVARLLRLNNRTADGLGLPMPAGNLVLFGAGRERPLLLGEGHVADKAVGEEVEVEVGPAVGVAARLVKLPADAGDVPYELTVSNDHDAPVQYEARFDLALRSSDRRLATKDKRSTWRVAVPANGRAVLRFRTGGKS
jgi:hypothetical protein